MVKKVDGEIEDEVEEGLKENSENDEKSTMTKNTPVNDSEQVQ